MKILYLCPDLGIPVLGRKGAAVHIREMVAALSRAGHQVVLAAQMLNKSPWEPAASLSVPFLQIRPSPGSTAAVQGLKDFNELVGVTSSIPGELRRILYNKELETELHRRFENERPDFIYERASLYATGGVALAQSLGVPLVLEMNAPLAQEQTAYRATGFADLAARAEQWTLGHADAVLVVSSLLGEHVRSLGVEPGRIYVQPNGVDLASFHPGPPDPSVRKRLGLDGGPVIGFVGGLRPWHGAEALPALLERLATTHPEVRLVIAGDGPLRNTLEQELAKRGLRWRVTLTGLVPHEEIPAVIRQFDVAVAPYPAPQHAFYFSPLKLFEYMACGIPVVAPEIGQIAEVLRHGETGLLYRAGDLEELAASCERLLVGLDLRRDLGTAAAKLVAERFTWDHNARRVVEITRALQRRSVVAGPLHRPASLRAGAGE